MYSLYRAWFGGEGSCAPLESRSVGPPVASSSVGLSPPDTLIRVGNDGEHQFVAHRSVLAAHSGYLKALLGSASSVTSSSGCSVASLSVSSVGGEAFAPLLNYMYTGRLEVTLDNIYSVLLATHLLHMPGALEQCRAALLKLRAPPATGGVLRPVPSRVVGPPICWPPPPSLYSTAPLPIAAPIGVPPSTVSHSGTVGVSTSVGDEGGIERGVKKIYNERSSSSSSPKPSTSQERARSRARSSSPETSLQRVDSRVTVLGQRRSPSPGEISEQISVTDSEPPRFGRIKNPQRSTTSGEQQGSGNIVIDIACCDGPVRFHRVLNANYSATAAAAAAAAAASNNGQQPRGSGEIVETVGGENDENVCEGEPEPGAGTETGNYTCGYCRHTFKSHYCYQKHARRHLHPGGAGNVGGGPSPQGSGGRRREVRLLDLNVQYYPCKICGSKFPSYYFVHKHRKLCHGGEDNQSGSDEPNNTVNNSSSNEPNPGSQ